MKRLLRYASAALTLALFLVSPVHALEEGTPYSSAYIAAYGTSLEQITDSAFRVWYEVVAEHGSKEEIGVTRIQVQKSSDGVNWTTMSTYTSDLHAKLIAKNTVTHTGYIVYVGTQGYYYRAYVTFYAKDSRGFGEIYEYTEVLYLQPVDS